MFKKFLGIVLLIIFGVSLTSCKSGKVTYVDDYKLTVASPSGAPCALITPYTVKDGKENPNFTLRKVPATALTAEFTNEENDFVIAPINAGINLYNKNKSTFKIAGVITWGNLFFASTMEDFSIDKINGKKLYSFNEASITSALVLKVLELYNITPSEIEYKGDAVSTAALISNDSVVVTAEPQLTMAKKQTSGINSLSVTSLYENKVSNISFTQAAIFVNPNSIETKKEGIDKFLKSLSELSQSVKNDPSIIADDCVREKIFTDTDSAKQALPGCNCYFKYAKEVKDSIIATANLGLNYYGGSLPGDEFYYA